jgi:pSer/pThr/pTyr-binding forkhead associated (FHA) protein
VGDVAVEIAYVSKAGASWESQAFDVEFGRAPVVAVAAPIAAAIPQLKLTVVAGKAARRTQVFSGGRIDIGRRSEVIDSKQRVVRTNHVAFEEGPESNRSVSRQHAHVTYHPDTREYRLTDDRSAPGTSVVRGGRTIAVPAGSRGVRIESGDEIIVGQARLRAVLL